MCPIVIKLGIDNEKGKCTNIGSANSVTSPLNSNSTLCRKYHYCRSKRASILVPEVSLLVSLDRFPFRVFADVLKFITDQ